MKYKYETVSISSSMWTGRSKDDFLLIINERGKDGWRFVTFAPPHVRPKGIKGIELIFEKPMEDFDLRSNESSA